MIGDGDMPDLTESRPAPWVRRGRLFAAVTNAPALIILLAMIAMSVEANRYADGGNAGDVLQSPTVVITALLLVAVSLTLSGRAYLMLLVLDVGLALLAAGAGALLLASYSYDGEVAMRGVMLLIVAASLMVGAWTLGRLYGHGRRRPQRSPGG